MTKERRELFNQLHYELGKSKGTAFVCATFGDEKTSGGDSSEEVVLIGAGSVPKLASLIASSAKQNDRIKAAIFMAMLELM